MNTQTHGNPSLGMLTLVGPQTHGHPPLGMVIHMGSKPMGTHPYMQPHGHPNP